MNFRRSHPDKKRNDWDSWRGDARRHRDNRQAPFTCEADGCVTIHRRPIHRMTEHLVEVACGPA